MSFADDLDTDLDDVFFADGDEFNVQAIITVKSSGAQLTVFGMYTDEFLETEDGGLSLALSSIEFMVKTAVVGTVRKGDTVRVADVDYALQDKRPDGVGVTTLMLEKKDE